MHMLLNFSARQFRFRPAVLPTLAAALCVVATVFLGHWQQGRAAEKRFQQALYDARSGAPAVRLGIDSVNDEQQFRQAAARGSWNMEKQIFVDNKVEHGTAGFHVMTPLHLDGSNKFVLVNRGWVARGGSYPLPPAVPAAAGVITITGTLVRPTSRFLELAPESASGRVWQNLTIERYRAATGLDVLPYVLLANVTDAPLVRVITQPNAGADKHTEYMLTWYSLALTAVILWIVLNMESVNTKTSNGANEAGAETKDLP